MQGGLTRLQIASRDTETRDGAAVAIAIIENLEVDKDQFQHAVHHFEWQLKGRIAERRVEAIASVCEHSRQIEAMQTGEETDCTVAVRRRGALEASTFGAKTVTSTKGLKLGSEADCDLPSAGARSNC